MVVKVDSLKIELNKLNELIKDYNFSILNLYNELSFSENYWKDKYSLMFYSNMKMEKRKNIKLILELNDIKKIYEILINNYSQLGNNINCVIENKNIVLNSIDDYLNKMNEIINLYNRLNLSFCPKEAGYLHNHLNILKSNYQKIQNSRNIVKSCFDKIEEIEKQVNLYISKIDIEYLKETDISGVL